MEPVKIEDHDEYCDCQECEERRGHDGDPSLGNQIDFDNLEGT